MRVAALDLGSNTTLMLIADVVDGRIQDVVVDETTVTKLGQGVHQNRRFHPEALERMRECLTRYAELIRRHRPEKVLGVATSAARDVQNGDELLKMAADLGIPIQIIAGLDEARLTFRGALGDGEDSENVAVIDVGGGSTELIYQKNDRIDSVSVDVGSVRLTEMFISAQPISIKELTSARQYARERFKKDAASLSRDGFRKVVGVAGTPTTLAAMTAGAPFSETTVHGFDLKRTAVENWIERLAPMSVRERENIPGMQPKRADVIVTGSIILSEAMAVLKADQIEVSTRGVRYGLAKEMSTT